MHLFEIPLHLVTFGSVNLFWGSLGHLPSK